MKTESGAKSDWKSQVVLLLLLCGATGFYAVLRGTDANWDLKNYHLYTAHAFLNGRLGFDVAPAQLQSFFNPLPNLPTYALIRGLNDYPRLIAFLMGAPAGVYAYALGGISLLVARRAFGPGILAACAAIITTVAGMTGAAVAPGIGVSSNDVAIGSLILLALWQVLRVLDVSPASLAQNWPAAATAGLLAGAALGLKLTNIIYAAPLGLAILAFLGLRQAIVAGVAMGLGFLVFWAPFAVMLWREFGNPVFPLYNHIFASPDYLPIHLADMRFLPRDALQTIFYPFYWLRSTIGLVTELRLRDPRVAIGYISALILLVDLLRAGWRKAWKTERPTLLILAFCLLAYAMWISLFGIYRYLLVVESLSIVLAMLACARLFAARRLMGIGVFAAVTLLAMTTTLRPNWGHARHYGLQAIQLDPAPLVPPGALLILLGGDPMGYLIPFLPDDVRAIGSGNNLMRLTDAHGLAQRGREAIASHAGPIWTATAPAMTEAAIEAALEPLRLRVGDCVLVRSNIAPAGHRLCELTRTGG